MAWVATQKIQWPTQIENHAIPPAMNATLLCDASGEKVSMQGRVMTPNRGTKNLSRVHFRFGTVVKTGGSTVTVSLQDYSNAAGAPGRPDEVQDQTVTIANADASFASNTWYRTGTFSASRSVAHGDQLCVVFEFGSFFAGDSFIISNFASVSANLGLQALNAHKAGAGPTWSAPNSQGLILLEFDDGTFGSIEGNYPATTINTTTFHLDTVAQDEVALAFTVPFPMKVDALWATILASNTAAWDMVLYNGTTQMAATSVNNRHTQASGVARRGAFPITEQTLTPGNTYYAAVKSTQNSFNVSVYDYQVDSAAHLDVYPMGQTAYFASRVNSGSWTPVTTRRPVIGFYQSAAWSGAASAPSYMLGLI